MKTNDVFPSKYLKAEDELFDNGEVTATIKSVVKETLTSRDSNKEEAKPVMYFVELDKGLILNKTNWGACVKMYGDESDNWVGDKVTLITVDVDAFGDVVSAIRIKNQKPKGNNRQTLLDRYQKLYEKALTLKVEGVENYVISPNMPDDEVITLGKELKAKVEAAEQF